MLDTASGAFVFDVLALHADSFRLTHVRGKVQHSCVRSGAGLFRRMAARIFPHLAALAQDLSGASSGIAPGTGCRSFTVSCPAHGIQKTVRLVVYDHGVCPAGQQIEKACHRRWALAVFNRTDAAQKFALQCDEIGLVSGKPLPLSFDPIGSHQYAYVSYPRKAQFNGRPCRPYLK